MAIATFVAVLSALFPPVAPFVPHAHATASWLNGWSYRQAITVDNAGMTSTLTNFPLYVPVSPTGNGAGIAGKVQDGGQDIRFTSSDGTTLLPYDREGYVEASGNVTAFFWTGVTLNADNDADTDDTIYLYYGNAGAADGQDTQNGTNDVWDANYKGVWHMDDASATTVEDETVNANDGSKLSEGNPVDALAFIGDGQSFDGNDYLEIADSSSWDFGTGPLSISMWFKKTVDARGDLFNKKNADASDDFGIMLEDGKLKVYLKIDSVGGFVVDNGSALTMNQWHYATLTRDGSSNMTTYLDGAPDGSGTSNANLDNDTADIWIGSNHNESMTPSELFNGLIDEVRISSVARSAAWTGFEYANMNEADHQLAFAEEEAGLNNWPYRKTITVQNANVASDLASFPLLVKINQDANLGAEAQSDGEDIRFATSSGVILPYEREEYHVTSGSGSGVFWVKVPTIKATGTGNGSGATIYLYYGKADAADGQSRTSVWDSNFVGVWHLSGSTLSGLDSTGNANNGAVSGASITAGKVDGAGSFDGTDDRLSIADNDAFDVDYLTISAWAKADVNNKWQYIAAKNSGTQQWDLGRDSDGKYYIAAWNSDGTLVTDAHSAATASTGTWEFVNYIYNGTTATCYVNASAVISDDVTGVLRKGVSSLTIGSEGTNNYWDGSIDELRVSSSARSVAWVTFEYYNMGEADNELSWSSQQDAVTGLSDTTTVLASSDASTSYGGSVTLTATVTPSPATGTMVFKNGGAQIGTTTLGHGSGSLTTSGLAAGVHSLTAEYGGDASYTASTSNTVTQTVAGAEHWPYRKKLTVDNTNVDSNLTNFPLLVKISQDADIGTQGLSDGDDIRFALSNGTILPYEREEYHVTSGSGSGNFWVKVPTIKATGTGNGSGATIYLYYGSGSAADGQDATNVWDANFEGVYHLGSSLTAESTSHAANGTNNGVTASPGLADGGGAFSPTTYISLPATLGRVSGNFTVETFFYPESVTGEQHLCSDWSAPEKNFLFEMNGTGLRGIVGDAGSNQDDSLEGGTIGIAGWYHGALTVNGTTQTLYLNGDSVDSQVGSYSGGVTTKQRYINTYGGIDTSYGLQGAMDEFRISSVTRSAAWIKFEYYNMGETDNELSISTEQDTATGLFVSSTTLASSDATTTVGDAVTLMATVSPSDATGTMTFKNGATTLGTATIGHGSGSLTTSGLATGVHSLTTEYGGDAAYAASTSNTVTQTVGAASSSSSSTSSSSSDAGGGSESTGGSGGGRRGSEESMSQRITTAERNIATRFAKTQEEGKQFDGTRQHQAGGLWDEIAAAERENRITERIAARKTAIATIEQTREEYAKKFAQHREERMARAVAEEEQKLAAEQANLLADEAALLAEQEENAKQREQRLAEREELDAIRNADEVLAAAEREKRIAERIAERKSEIARIEQLKDEYKKKFAQHREERMAQALALEEKHLAEEQAALLADEAALLAEKEANTQRRTERLAEQERPETQQLKSAAPPLDRIAARRDRLYVLVDETPVLYADVPLTAWYAPYVSYVIEEKIAEGYRDEAGNPKGEFGVENPVTYAEMLKMALEAAGSDLTGVPPPRNTSAADTWASAYVAKAEALPLSVFSPDLDVTLSATRGAVIQTILETMGITIGKTQATYEDVPADHPYSAAIASATFFGLVEGDKDASGVRTNRFRPDDPINRAEVAKIIALAKELAK